MTLDSIGFASPDGVREVTGWLSDLHVTGSISIGGEGGDLRVRVPENTFVPLAGTRLGPDDDDRWQLLVTVVAGRTGRFAPTDVEVRYHDDEGHKGTLRIRFVVDLDVTKTGIDPDSTKRASA